MSDRGPMTIAVLIKQVPDMNAVRIDRSSGRIVPSAQLVMSSYDGYAVEAALRLKESFGGEVIAISVGPATARDALTRALAMGADRAVHLLVAEPNAVDTLGIARLLADAIGSLSCDLVIVGQASDDLEAGQVGAQVAALLAMPVISNVVSIAAEDDGVTVSRDMEDGYQTVRSPLPAVVLASTGLDEPRLPSLKGIMAAKKKPIDLAEVEVAASDRLTWGEPYVPARTSTGVMLQDVPAGEAAKQLVAWLQEQKVL